MANYKQVLLLFLFAASTVQSKDHSSRQHHDHGRSHNRHRESYDHRYPRYRHHGHSKHNPSGEDLGESTLTVAAPYKESISTEGTKVNDKPEASLNGKVISVGEDVLNVPSISVNGMTSDSKLEPDSINIDAKTSTDKDDANNDAGTITIGGLSLDGEKPSDNSDTIGVEKIIPSGSGKDFTIGINGLVPGGDIVPGINIDGEIPNASKVLDDNVISVVDNTLKPNIKIKGLIPDGVNDNSDDHTVSLDIENPLKPGIDSISNIVSDILDGSSPSINVNELPKTPKPNHINGDVNIIAELPHNVDLDDNSGESPDLNEDVDSINVNGLIPIEGKDKSDDNKESPKQPEHTPDNGKGDNDIDNSKTINVVDSPQSVTVVKHKDEADKPNVHGLLPGGDGEKRDHGPNRIHRVEKPDHHNVIFDGSTSNDNDFNKNELPSGGVHVHTGPVHDNSGEVHVDLPKVHPTHPHHEVKQPSRPDHKNHDEKSPRENKKTTNERPAKSNNNEDQTNKPIIGSSGVLPVYLPNNIIQAGGGSMGQNAQSPAYYIVMINGQATLVRNPSVNELPSLINSGASVGGQPQPQYPVGSYPSSSMYEPVPQPIPQSFYPQAAPYPYPDMYNPGNQYVGYPNMPYPYMWPPMWDNIYPSVSSWPGLMKHLMSHWSQNAQDRKQSNDKPDFSKDFLKSKISNDDSSIKPENPKTVTKPEKESVPKDISVKPKPVSPHPAEPVTTKPPPKETRTVEPLPIEPVSPQPKEPVIIEPISKEPHAVEPLPKEPVVVEPLPKEPVTVKPLPKEPVVVEPLPKEPVVVKPLPKEPEKVKPVTVKTRPIEVVPVTEHPLPEEPPVESHTLKPILIEPIVDIPNNKPDHPDVPMEIGAKKDEVNRPITIHSGITSKPEPEVKIPQENTPGVSLIEVTNINENKGEDGKGSKPGEKISQPAVETPNIRIPIIINPSKNHDAKPKPKPKQESLVYALINLLNNVLKNRTPTPKPHHSKENDSLEKLLLAISKSNSKEKDVKEILEILEKKSGEKQSDLGSVSQLLHLIDGQSQPNLNILVEEPGMDEATRSNLIMLLNLLANNLANDYSPGMGYYESMNVRNPLLYFLGHFPCDNPNYHSYSSGPVGQHRGLWEMLSNMYDVHGLRPVEETKVIEPIIKNENEKEPIIEILRDRP